MIWSKLRTTDINYVLIYSFVVMIMSLPLPNKSVHSIDEIFFLISHVYNLPFNTTNLCVQTNKQNKKFNLRAENEWKKTPLLKANIYIYIKAKELEKDTDPQTQNWWFRLVPGDVDRPWFLLREWEWKIEMKKTFERRKAVDCAPREGNYKGY